MSPNPGFLDFPAQLPGGVQPRIVLFGAPHGSTYPGADSSGFAGAAAAIRAASQGDAQFLDSWDFDLGGPLFEGREPCCVDAGDLLTSVLDNAGNRKLIEETTRAILAAGAAPLMIGGDDSVPIPFIAGFADHGAIWILQIDAHIDWRDERHGEPLGYSSTMRRASEMPHVAGIVSWFFGTPVIFAASRAASLGLRASRSTPSTASASSPRVSRSSPGARTSTNSPCCAVRVAEPAGAPRRAACARFPRTSW